MRTATRKILIAVTALLAAVCLAFGAVMLVTGNKLTVSDERVEAAGAMQSYTKTYTLKDGGGKTKKSIWQTEVLDNANQTTNPSDPKRILVILGENWNLDDTSNSGANNLGTSLIIPANFYITLDLNGKTLSRSTGFVAGGNVISVFSSADFTLNDSAGGGQVSGGKNTNHGGGICVFGKFTMNGGRVGSTSAPGNQSQLGGGNIFVDEAAEAVINGGTISYGQANVGSSVTWGGGGLFVFGELTLNGGTITNNSCTYYGGGVYLFKNSVSARAIFTMNGGTITSNSGMSGGVGQGAAGISGAVVNINGGVITNNTATSTAINGICNASALLMGVYSTLNITGGSITGNTSSGLPTVSLANCDVYMTGGSISNNTITSHAVIYSYSSSSPVNFYMSGGSINNNACANYGAFGAANTVNGSYVLTGGTISGNTGYGVTYSTGMVRKVGGNIVITDNALGDMPYVAGTSGSYIQIVSPLLGAKIGISDATGNTTATDKDFTSTSGTAATLIDGGYPPSSVFFSTDSGYEVARNCNPGTGEAKLSKIGVSTDAPSNNRVTFKWEYELNGTSTVAQTNTVELTYGDTISWVKATGLSTNGVGVVETAATAPFTDGSIRTVSNDGTVIGAALFTSSTIKDVGTYTCTINQSNLNSDIANPGLTFVVKPKDVSVTFNNADMKATYGMTDAELLTYLKTGKNTTVTPNTDLWTASDTVNLDFIKDFGTDVGTYLVTGKPDVNVYDNNTQTFTTLKSNPNYNITFTNVGKLTIVPREVELILNDDYYTYGDSKMKESQVINSSANNNNALVTNSIVTRTENETTVYKDDAGNNKTGTASDYYKGGWYYPATQSNGNSTTNDNKFIAASLTANVPEFLEYKWNTTLASGTDYHAQDTTDKYLNVRSAEANGADSTAYPNTYYEIAVKNTNKNYTLKFFDADGTAIGTDDNGTFQLEVRRAEQSGSLKAINETPTPPAPKVGKYTGATYDGNAKTIALPDITLVDIIKGFKAEYGTPTPTNRGPLAVNSDGLASTTTFYKYLVYDKAKLIMSPAVANLSDGETQCPTQLEPLNGTPTAAEMATAATYVKNNGSATETVNAKGTYVVYVVAEPTNHKPKVYKFEYKLDVSGIKYRIVVEQKKTDGSNTVVSTLTLDSSSNYALTGAKNNKVTYDPDLKVEARVIYEWQTEFVSTATDTAPTGWNATDGSAPDVELYYKGQAATIAGGTPAHGNAWGYGYMATDTGVDTNAEDNSGKKADGTTDQKLGYNVAPTEAGEYVVSFLDKNAANSNFNLVPDVTNGDKVKFEIERKELKKPDAPLPQGTDTGVYTGLAQTYAIVPKTDGSYTYKMSMFKAGKVTSNAFDGSGFNTGLTEGTASDTKKEYTVTNAGKYKIALQLPLDAVMVSGNYTKARNYKWENEATKDYIEVELELAKKELSVEWYFLNDDDAGTPGVTPGLMDQSYKANINGTMSIDWIVGPNQKYDSSGNPVLDVNNDPEYEEPVLEYYYKYITDKKDGTGTVAIGNLTTINPAKIESLKDGSNAHGAGVYVVGVRLSTAAADKAVNDNYCFKIDPTDLSTVDTEKDGTSNEYDALGTYFMQVEITAGEADLNDISVRYKKGSGAVTPITSSTTFTYERNASGTAIEYVFSVNFTQINYLEPAGATPIVYQEWDENGLDYVDMAPGTASLKNAGKYCIAFTVQVKSTDTQHQLPQTSEYKPKGTGTGQDPNAKFVKYVNNGDGTGTLYYEVEIGRAEVDLSGLKYQYKSGTGTYAAYNATTPPKMTGLSFDVQINPNNTLLPAGVLAAAVDTSTYGSNRINPGKVEFEVEVTLDPNYQYSEKNADGTPVLDGNNKPVVHVGDGTATFHYASYIQIAKEQIKIKWKYAPLKDPSGNDILDPTTNAPFLYRTLDVDSKYNGVYMCVYTYAGDTQEYYGAAGLNQLRLNNGIDSTNPQLINVEVKIVDNSADPLKPQFQDQYEFASGSRTTTFILGQKMYVVTVTVNHEAQEYGETLSGGVYSLAAESGAPAFNDAWCTATLWLGTEEIGALSEVDLTSLPAGVYTVKLALIEAAQDSYLLSENSFTFTVDPKELDVPELTANGVFNAKNQKLVDLLQVGKKSYSEAYGDLINDGILVLGGDFDGRNAGDYEATITITSDNYIWKKSASNTAKLLKVSLEEETLPKAEIDSAKKVATYEWSIAPFVITSDMVSKSKENGLELNLPEWIAALTAGEVPTLGWEQNVYESASSNSKLNGAEGFAFESGKEYYISVSLNGEDAKNFIFQDSKTNISNKVEYQVAVSGFSAAMTKALDFLKANWWWLLIILGAILFLILLIVLIKKHKKNKEAREEKRRLEEEKREEKERKERERQEEKERRELEKQEEKERREQERREEKERREEEERRRREEEERRRREEEERRRNTPIPIPMPQMAATMQSQLQAQPQMQAQPQPQQAQQPQPQPQQAQPKQQPPKPKKRPMPENGMVRGFVPNGDGTYSPVNIRMKKRGMPDYPQMPMGYGMGMNPMGMQMPMMPQQPMYPQQGYAMPGMDNRPAEVRIAEERARAAEERAKIAELRMAEERLHTSEERANSRVAEERARKSESSGAVGSGLSSDVLGALLVAAVRGIAGANAPLYNQQQPAIQQPAQPQPILITNQQPVQPQQPMPQDGRPVVPPGAVMTTTSTTTIDATKRQSPNGTAYDYDDNYDYGVFEQFDDKNN